jgi:hypothetical protein
MIHAAESRAQQADHRFQRRFTFYITQVGIAMLSCNRRWLSCTVGSCATA